MSVFSSVPLTAVKTVALRIKMSVFDCAKRSVGEIKVIEIINRKTITFFIFSLRYPRLAGGLRPRLIFFVNGGQNRRLNGFRFLRNLRSAKRNRAAGCRYGSADLISRDFTADGHVVRVALKIDRNGKAKTFGGNFAVLDRRRLSLRRPRSGQGRALLDEA